MSIPLLRSISKPKAGGCQASPGSIPLMEESMHWWRTVQRSLPCLYTIVALLSGRATAATVTKPMISMQGYDTNGFFFRNSWGSNWGNNGCGYLPFSDWNRVVKAWVGLSKRTGL